MLLRSTAKANSGGAIVASRRGRVVPGVRSGSTASSAGFDSVNEVPPASSLSFLLATGVAKLEDYLETQRRVAWCC